MTRSTTPPPPHAHVGLIPGSGMGHITPFLRLAAALSSRGCRVTLVTPHPFVSLAESSHLSAFLSSHPDINHHNLHLTLSSDSAIEDPFFKQVEALRRSLHLLRSILDHASPPLSALVTDIFLADSMAGILSHLALPNYVLFTSSARFLAFVSRLALLMTESGQRVGDDVEFPGADITPVPLSSIPPPLQNPEHGFFPALVLANARALLEFDGVLVNTFSGFEGATLEALNSGRVVQNLPPILPIGMLPPVDIQSGGNGDELVMGWLDAQPAGSVLLLSFGSRTAMSTDQIGEIAKALELSRQRFVWILKGSIVDRDDKDDVTDLLGQPFLDWMQGQAAGSRTGMVMREWVNQDAILSHSAIGGFVSHCGWNSVTEAAARGVPVLAWPLHGDQRVNAEVVVEAGLGIWDRSWGWGGERLVGGEEIARKLVELMGDAELKRRAASVGQEASTAAADGGSSDQVFKTLITRLN